MPTIGFLHSGSPEQNVKRMAAFHKGLAEAGFTEGQNVAIEYRWAAGQSAKLPEMAADLVQRKVALIVTPGSTPASQAAKAATSTIPIVFGVGADPVALGLVASLSRPGGNATGITSLNADLAAKRLGLLRDLMPKVSRYYAMINPTSALGATFLKDMQSTAASLGIPIDTLRA
ncbi:MAG: ABC transporter substrate-binding protein, partial [Bradyrhizobium sp.]